MFRTIVVATDLSTEAERAVEHAVALARHGGGRVILAHVETVTEPIELGLTPDGAALPVFQQFMADEIAESRRQLDALVVRHAGAVALESEQVEGFPDRAIIELGERRGADLLVLGTHGKSRLDRVLLGSVAEKVVRTAERPVLVARGAAPAAGYRRILVPTDFSPLAARALDAALALAAADAEVILFHGWQLSFGRYLPGRASDKLLEPVRGAVEAAARAKAEAIIAAHPGRRLSFEIAEGVPGHELLERALGCDLIAMGSHGRRGVRRWLLGSLAEATVRNAPCSVLVVHGDVD